MDMLKLNCWVRGQDPGRIFEVDIPRRETVAALKEAIKNKMPTTFHDVDADALDLYRPKEPLSRPYEKSLSTLILSENAKSLQTGADELSEVFPEQPPKCDLHIIVDAPLIIICWMRGATLGLRFLVSIRPGEYVNQAIRRIKDAQPDLRDVADHRIRLYRTSGDENELQESLNKTGDGIPLQGDTLLPEFLSVPVLVPLHVIVEVSASIRSTLPPPLWHSDLGGVDPIATARKNFIQSHPQKKSLSDGSHPSSFRKTQRAQNTQIPCGRPRDPEEIIPVTLLHPVFGQFVDDCRTGTMTTSDNQFAGKLANAMSDLYQDEKQRVTAVGEVFKEAHLHLDMYTKIPGTTYVMDASLSVDDPGLPPFFISEFKNEAAASTSEPYMQAVAYYLEATRIYAPKLPTSPLPCFLLAVFGPYMVFAGVVWNLRPIAQVLSTPLAFHYHSSDTQNQLIAARHMAALRKALRTLEAYYQNLSKRQASENQSGDTLFPYRTEFRSLKDGSMQTICYTKQLAEGGEKKGLVFFGTLKEDSTVRICVKFVRRYSKEAHLRCTELGFAPKLRGFEALPGGWYMVVTDELVGYDLLADLPRTDRLPGSAFKIIRTRLKALHACQLVHGDLRDTNIFVKKDDRTKLVAIDFDWGGIEGVVQYPPFVNYADIWRPKDARDGLPIKAAHDLAMLDAIAETWAAEYL